MNVINSIWVTVILLSFLVVVHEFGHYIMARIFGVTVYEFSIGFGPLIGKFTRGETQYSLRWFLLGGFVKIAGMDIVLEGDNPEAQETEKSFRNLPLWKKISVIAAGPIFNVLLAIVLFIGIATLIGFPDGSLNNEPVIQQATPGSPAFDAGLRPGDRLVEINNHPIKQWTEIGEFVTKSEGQPMDIVISRNGILMAKKITPYFDHLVQKYRIGIEPAPNLRRVSFGDAMTMAISLPWTFTQQVFKIFGMMFKGQVRDGLMGPIGMVTVMEQYLALPFTYILYNILFQAVGISMFLFIFNMLPIPLPLLDGGWIVIMLLEKLFRHEFTTEQKAAAQMFGLLAVLAAGALIAYGDLLRAFRRFFGG